jgi:hypothetical protein
MFSRVIKLLTAFESRKRSEYEFSAVIDSSLVIVVVFVFVVAVLSLDPNQPATPLQELSDRRATAAMSRCFMSFYLQKLDHD